MSETAIIPAEKFNLARVEGIDTLPASFDDALKLLKGAGVEIGTAAAELPEEFPEIDKKHLVNKAFLLLTWNISSPDRSDYGRQYIVCRGITRDGKKFRFTDGSTGIFAQLIALTAKRVKAGSKTPNAGLLVEGGLTVSEYNYTDTNTGEVTKAKTYYLANS